MSIDKWVDKPNVGYSCLKKEENSNIWYNIDEPWGHYAKWNSHKNTKSIQKYTDTKSITNTVWSHLYGTHRAVKFIEIESRLVIVARD